MSHFKNFTDGEIGVVLTDLVRIPLSQKTHSSNVRTHPLRFTLGTGMTIEQLICRAFDIDKVTSFQKTEEFTPEQWEFATRWSCFLREDFNLLIARCDTENHVLVYDIHTHTIKLNTINKK